MRQNATRMAVERIQALAATTPAASAPTAPYAQHKAKEPQVDGDGPHGRKKNKCAKWASVHMAELNSVHMAALNSVHITRSESARAGLKY